MVSQRRNGQNLRRIMPLRGPRTWPRKLGPGHAVHRSRLPVLGVGVSRRPRALDVRQRAEALQPPLERRATRQRPLRAEDGPDMVLQEATSNPANHAG